MEENNLNPIPGANEVVAPSQFTIGMASQQLQSAIIQTTKESFVQAAATNPTVGQSTSVSREDDRGHGPSSNKLKKSNPGQGI